MNSNKIRMLWIVFISILIILLISDLFIHRHSYFEIDGLFAFPSIFGFLSCILLVVISKIIGIFLKRSEDYYDN
jgi:UPF0716 family protein affecting phage T7 exclusion